MSKLYRKKKLTVFRESTSNNLNQNGCFWCQLGSYECIFGHFWGRLMAMTKSYSLVGMFCSCDTRILKMNSVILSLNSKLNWNSSGIYSSVLNEAYSCLPTFAADSVARREAIPQKQQKDREQVEAWITLYCVPWVRNLPQYFLQVV